MHGKGARIILWATSMVDVDSPNYAEAKARGYFVETPFGTSPPLKWWHGRGGLVDYSNHDAVAWWHGQMDQVLDLGIDGFKCDGTDPYLALYALPRGRGGPLSYRAYADAYYGDFFDYTRARLGEDRLIMSRPVDSYPVLGPVADAYLSFSPRRVVLSGWVGDQDPTFAGLRDALRNMVHSAWRGYPNFGSDIGGYRSGHRSAELFTRWFQVGAFTPLMENGGEGRRQPWAFDAPGSEATTATYRRFATQHDELVPYLLAVGSEALRGGGSSMRPLAPRPRFDLLLQLRSDIRTFDFTLGDRIFVSPIADAGVRVVTLSMPGTLSEAWADLFHPSRGLLRGGAVFRYPAPLQDLPVFLRAGAILPLHATSTLLGHAPRDTPPTPAPATASTPLTLLVHRPSPEGGDGFAVREFRRTGVRVAYQAEARNATLRLRASPYDARPVAWLVREVVPAGGVDSVPSLSVAVAEAGAAAAATLRRVGVTPPLYRAWERESAAVPTPKSAVPPGICEAQGPWFAKGPAANAGFRYDAEARTLWVFAGCATRGVTVTVEGLVPAPIRYYSA